MPSTGIVPQQPWLNNTPQQAILATLGQVAEMCAEHELYDAAQALHELHEPIRQLHATEQLLHYHHTVFRSKQLQPAEKLVLIDAHATLTWAEANGHQDHTELYIPSRSENVALSPKTYGRLLKKLDGYGALGREEIRDSNGHTRIQMALSTWRGQHSTQPGVGYLRHENACYPFLQRLPLPARNHRSCRLALQSLRTQLSGCRGDPVQAGRCGDVRDGAAVVLEVRPDLCQPVTLEARPSRGQVASG